VQCLSIVAAKSERARATSWCSTLGRSTTFLARAWCCGASRPPRAAADRARGRAGVELTGRGERSGEGQFGPGVGVCYHQLQDNDPPPPAAHCLAQNSGAIWVVARSSHDCVCRAAAAVSTDVARGGLRPANV